jgi:PHD/YefM family antitoxin component YafN of YafNO toxin-antitoxin module
MTMKRVSAADVDRNGVRWLADQAADGPVAVSRWGRPMCVVAPPGAVEAMAAQIQQLRSEVMGRYLDVAADRSAAQSPPVGLDEACARLGISADAVRAQAERVAGG